MHHTAGLKIFPVSSKGARAIHEALISSNYTTYICKRIRRQGKLAFARRSRQHWHAAYNIAKYLANVQVPCRVFLPLGETEVPEIPPSCRILADDHQGARRSGLAYDA
jgi:hypothetical protein